MQYNERTSTRIRDWSQRFNFKQLHHRILKAVFRSAWRETTFQTPGGGALLSQVRGSRHRSWWESVKHESVWTRTHHGFKHWKKGPRTEWEDSFVEVYGYGWRAVRDSCQDAAEWESLLPDFINTLCRNWGLPTIASKKEPAAICMEPPEKKAKQYGFDGVPSSHWEQASEETYDWHRKSCSFAFIVDCKGLQSLVCGHSSLQGDGLKPIFERTLTNLVNLYDRGWTPAVPWDDPVAWQRREKNKIADYLANLTMEHKNTWSREAAWPFPGYSLEEVNVLAHSDGGTRHGQCSAAAWVVELGLFLEGRWIYKVLSMGGTFFQTPISSFSAELRALESCSQCVKAIFEYMR
jgi:hypothetical protein